MRPKTNYRVEISRKVLHVSSALIPLVYIFIDRETMWWLLVPCVCLIVAIEILRQVNPRGRRLFRRCFGVMVRGTEWHRLSGSTYVLVGALVSVWVFPKTIAIAGLLVLSISDSAASLVGLRFGRASFLGKSLAGSFAFFASSVIILWFAWPQSHGVALAAALVATIAEALPSIRLGRVELNDNLTIPLLTGATLWLLQRDAAPVELVNAFLNP